MEKMSYVRRRRRMSQAGREYWIVCLPRGALGVELPALAFSKAYNHLRSRGLVNTS
ncbi:hypothetical protein BAUCODRAFT_229455 [Baudoinia panamericana UAMH 10762]|uniref:Uncharacterized protein n=1 Tax=Baudoinia panamericana (strain UAMH 10762) TaxID=717646 RepID=M2N380_BAUPA|nr:uncharacterized protein BAUCODRAFT_229455 [Baudoinia panamericana UAMH 10762]EMC93155.1 hypothetical protein BAUCODRAFT_229455 [Baudoinia panamericana UAMH 10762]